MRRLATQPGEKRGIALVRELAMKRVKEMAIPMATLLVLRK